MKLNDTWWYGRKNRYDKCYYRDYECYYKDSIETVENTVEDLKMNLEMVDQKVKDEPSIMWDFKI